jgi:hypothetical protein
MITRPAAVAGLTVACFVAAMRAPMAVLLLAPLALGVPHVVSDLRFLVLSPGAPGRGAGAWLALPLTLLLASRVGAALGIPSSAAAEWAIGGLGALGLISLAPHGARRTGVAAAVTVALAVGLEDPRGAALILGHLHNLIALGMLAWLGRPVVAGAAALPSAVGAALLLGGAADASIGQPFAGLSVDGLAATLAPGLDPLWGGRVVACFAFLQLVHYATWVAWIPASSARSWFDDLGRSGVAVAVAASALLPLLAFADPPAVRATYLSLVLFHGWLELLVGAGAAAGRADA